MDAIFRNRVDNFTSYEYDEIMKRFKKELKATSKGDFIDVVYKDKKRKVHLFRYDTYNNVAYTDLSDAKLLGMFNGYKPFTEETKMNKFDTILEKAMYDNVNIDEYTE